MALTKILNNIIIIKKSLGCGSMNYSDKFNSTIEQMNQFYNTYGKEENFKEQLIKYYIEKNLIQMVLHIVM